MLSVLLLRHAKALPDHGGGDHARPLSARGLEDAAALASRLAKDMAVPDQILASDALRTSQTMTTLLAQWPEPVPAQLSAGLYNASAANLLDAIQRTGASARSIMVIAHNPGIAELALSLTGYGDRYAATRMGRKFPTCGLAVLDFDVAEWRDIHKRGGRLDRFVVPLGDEDTH